MSGLKIKICGMKDPANIAEVSRLSPDFMGFIYFRGSRRFAGELSPGTIAGLPDGINRVGVFVNHPAGEALSVCRRMGFRSIQLHGAEPPDYCREMGDGGLQVIKAFNIGEGTEFSRLHAYVDYCDLFLFDTAGPGFGGTGRKFDWDRLGEYELDKPFFLSGGIGPPDVRNILGLEHPMLYGVDLNSGFETGPGLKDANLLLAFMKEIRSANPENES